MYMYKECQILSVVLRIYTYFVAYVIRRFVPARPQYETYVYMYLYIGVTVLVTEWSWVVFSLKHKVIYGPVCVLFVVCAYILLSAFCTHISVSVDTSHFRVNPTPLPLMPPVEGLDYSPPCT